MQKEDSFPYRRERISEQERNAALTNLLSAVPFVIEERWKVPDRKIQWRAGRLSELNLVAKAAVPVGADVEQYQTAHWTDDQITDFYSEKARVRAIGYGENFSPLDYWMRPELRSRWLQKNPELLRIQSGNFQDAPDRALAREAIYESIQEARPAYSSVSKSLYSALLGLSERKYSHEEPAVIVDISAYGERAIAAAGLDVPLIYHGVDPDLFLVEGHRELLRDLQENPATKNKNLTFHSVPLEKFYLLPGEIDRVGERSEGSSKAGERSEGSSKAGERSEGRPMADLITISPPPFTAERYSGDQQSFRVFDSVEKWFAGFLCEIAVRASEMIRDGGIFAFTALDRNPESFPVRTPLKIGNVFTKPRDSELKLEYVEAFSLVLQSLGFEYLGAIGFASGGKRASIPWWVFRLTSFVQPPGHFVAGFPLNSNVLLHSTSSLSTKGPTSSSVRSNARFLRNLTSSQSSSPLHERFRSGVFKSTALANLQRFFPRYYATALPYLITHANAKLPVLIREQPGIRVSAGTIYPFEKPNFPLEIFRWKIMHLLVRNLTRVFNATAPDLTFEKVGRELARWIMIATSEGTFENPENSGTAMDELFPSVISERADFQFFTNLNLPPNFRFSTIFEVPGFADVSTSITELMGAAARAVRKWRLSSRDNQFAESALLLSATRTPRFSSPLAARYETLGAKSHHFTRPRSRIEALSEINDETPLDMFATQFNANSQFYCSPFSDLEIGSLGSAWLAELTSGSYLIDPVDTPQFLDAASDRCVTALRTALQTNKHLTFFCGFTVWNDGSDENFVERFRIDALEALRNCANLAIRKLTSETGELIQAAYILNHQKFPTVSSVDEVVRESALPRRNTSSVGIILSTRALLHPEKVKNLAKEFEWWSRQLFQNLDDASEMKKFVSASAREAAVLTPPSLTPVKKLAKLRALPVREEIKTSVTSEEDKEDVFSTSVASEEEQAEEEQDEEEQAEKKAPPKLPVKKLVSAVTLKKSAPATLKKSVAEDTVEEKVSPSLKKSPARLVKTVKPPPKKFVAPVTTPKLNPVFYEHPLVFAREVVSTTELDKNCNINQIPWIVVHEAELLTPFTQLSEPIQLFLESLNIPSESKIFLPSAEDMVMWWSERRGIEYDSHGATIFAPFWFSGNEKQQPSPLLRAAFRSSGQRVETENKFFPGWNYLKIPIPGSAMSIFVRIPLKADSPSPTKKTPARGGSAAATPTPRTPKKLTIAEKAQLPSPTPADAPAPGMAFSPLRQSWVKFDRGTQKRWEKLGIDFSKVIFSQDILDSIADMA